MPSRDITVIKKGEEETLQRPKPAELIIRGLPNERLQELNSFIASIKKIPYFKPDGKPSKKWKVFYGDTLAEAWVSALDAARAAAWDVARDVPLATARDAAWATALSAARDAALGESRDAAWAAAWDAARDAAWDSASGSARVTAGDAVLDAALMAQLIIVKDLEFEDKTKHIRHAAERMDAWSKGYGVAADVNGVLYVYCVGEPE
jgi:hypothetical protein